jgi:taurine dioxygenase
MRVNRLCDALGAEITGVDVTDLNDQGLREIHKAFLRHQVIVLRDQRLTPEQHVAFSRRLGDLEIHISKKYLLDGFPEILVLSNRKRNGAYIGVENAGDYWHSDLSYMERPSLGSLLYALEVPPQGGDTEWSNQYLAYGALSESTKRRIEGLRAIHTFNRVRNPRVHIPEHARHEATDRYERISPPDAIRPIVRTHPETRRKALYVSPRFTIGVAGMADEEAQPLLDELFESAVKPKFIYHHKWRLGDLLMWDNRCLLHLACRGIPEGQIRHMHRTTLSGDIPF